MSDTTFDPHEQTVSQQTNVAGDAVGRDKITVNGVGNIVTVIQQLTDGARPLPTDYAARIHTEGGQDAVPATSHPHGGERRRARE